MDESLGAEMGCCFMLWRPALIGWVSPSSSPLLSSFHAAWVMPRLRYIIPLSQLQTGYICAVSRNISSPATWSWGLPKPAATESPAGVIAISRSMVGTAHQRACLSMYVLQAGVMWLNGKLLLLTMQTDASELAPAALMNRWSYRSSIQIAGPMSTPCTGLLAL